MRRKRGNLDQLKRTLAFLNVFVAVAMTSAKIVQQIHFVRHLDLLIKMEQVESCLRNG